MKKALKVIALFVLLFSLCVNFGGCSFSCTSLGNMHYIQISGCSNSCGGYGTNNIIYYNGCSDSCDGYGNNNHVSIGGASDSCEGNGNNNHVSVGGGSNSYESDVNNNHEGSGGGSNSSTGSETKNDNEHGAANENVPFNSSQVLNQLEVTEYSYTEYSRVFTFLAIKNNSCFELEISAKIKYYDVYDELIEETEKIGGVLASNSEMLLSLNTAVSYATVEYELSVEEATYRKSAVHDLSCESIKEQTKAVVSVTNNGEKAVIFVTAHVLFFNGDKLVGHRIGFFEDDEHELKPGETMTETLDCYEEYTSVRVFLSGFVYYRNRT